MRRRRLVIQIAGYDAARAREHYRRFVRQIAIFAQTWHLQVAVSQVQEGSGFPAWTVRATGPNWCQDSMVELWPWDDIIRGHAKGPALRRLIRAFDAYLEFLITGTMFRYVSANFHYFLFAIAPLVQLICLAVVAWGGASAVVQVAGLTGLPAAAVATLTSNRRFLCAASIVGQPLEAGAGA
jgi:hypothetical protein